MRKMLVMLLGMMGMLLNGGEVVLPPVESWQWQWFFTPGMPDGIFADGQRVGNELTLPDGRKLPGHKFDFGKGDKVDLYKIVTPKPAVLERTVVVADIKVPESGRVVLGCGVDWKFKLYVNGVLKYDTTPFGNGEIPTSSNDHLLEFEVKAGVNQLIWEVFGGDKEFVLALKQKMNIPALHIVGQPLVSFPDSSDNSCAITFAASRNTPAGIDIRCKGQDSWKRIYNSIGGQIRRDSSVHYLRLSGLKPDQEYEYRLILIDELKQNLEYVASRVYTFKTLPDAENSRPFTFIATSDLQVPAEARRKFMQQMLNTPEGKAMDFFAFIGDIDWTSNFPQAVIRDFVDFYLEAVDCSKPMVMVRGNHEMYGKETNRYFSWFPTVPGGKEGYGLFRCGEVCFIVLDFGDDTPRCPAPSTRSLHNIEPYLAEQTIWLKKALESPEFKSAKFRIVLAHATPLGYGRGYMPENVRRVIDPFFGGANPKYKIHLWIGGHVHRPFRSVPGKNLYRSITSAKGEKLNLKHPAIGANYNFTVAVMGGPNKFVAGNMHLTSMLVKVDKDAIELIHRDKNNRAFDHIKITPDGKLQEVMVAEDFPQYEY